ncbi:MAG TPA: hypothetical protein VNV85_04125 [Puia sp.]|jgi:hypothetical protein|nr:hypothetical protein [Puia sp.]
MKTNNFLRISLLAVSLATCVFACKKNSSSSSTTSNSSIETSADDQTMVSNENDALNNDATAAVTASPSISGGASFNRIGNNKPGGSVLGGDSVGICDANVTFDTTSSTKTITITYNGTNCWGNRIRTGTVVITAPRDGYWKVAGAAISLTITNLKITRIVDGKFIIINGTKTITNTDGYLVIDLPNIDSVVHDITSSFTVTYGNGSTRTWSENKHRVFSYNNGYVITTTGGETGVNRLGVGFTTLIAQPKVIEQTCEFRLVGGKDSTTRTDNITSSTTFGLDASGNPVSSCPAGYYYAEFVWSNANNGKIYTFIFPY